MKAQSIVVAICFAFINYGNAQGIISYGGYINSTSSSYIILDNGGSLTLDEFNNTAVVVDLDGNTIISGDLNNATSSITMLDASTGVIEFNGSNIQYVDGPDNMELNTIKISNDVELKSNLIISKAIILNSGNLILDVNDLKVLNGGSVSGESSGSYIIPESTGMLQLYVISGGTTTIFPIGTSTSYSPATITLISGNSQYFDAIVFDGVFEEGTTGTNLALTDPVVDRTWILNADGIHLADVSMQWNESDEVNGFDRTTALANSYDIDWTSSAASITGIGPYVLTLTALSDIDNETVAVSGGSGTLPIELLSFFGNYNSNVTELNWTTASEFNNDYFVVERAITMNYDNFQWTEIGKIKGMGTSNEVLNYMFIDENPNTSVKTNYYRLKQVDYNGSFSYSDIIPVNINGNGDIKVFPNPSSDGIFYFKGMDNSNIEIYNAMGQMLSDVDTTKSKIDLSNEPSGIYYIRYAGEFIKVIK